MNRRLNISWKLFIVYLIITVPLVIIIAITYSDWYNARLDSVLRDRFELARSTGNSFLLFTRDINRTMKTIGRAIVDNKYSERRAESALRELHTDYPIAYAIFADPSGIVTFSTKPRLIGENLSKHKAFIEIINEKRTRGIDNNENFLNYTGFHITQAVMSKKGRLQGIVSAFVDVAKLPQVIPVKVEAGGVNIVDSSGHVVFQSEFPDMAKEMAFWGNYDFIRTALSGKDALNRDFVFPKTGIIRVGAEVPIQDLGWASGSLINVDKAVGPLRRDIVIAGAITTVIALIALAVSFLVARRIIGSLSALVDKARLVGEGRFEEPVFLKTGDEVEDVARSLDETRLNLKNYIEGLSGVAETGHLLTSSVEIEGVKTAIAGAMERIFGAIAVWILIFDKETERLETFMWSGPGAEEFSRVTFRPGNGVAGKVFQTGKAAAVPDVQAEPTFIGKELASRFGIKSVIQLPLIIGEKTIGVLGMFSSVVKTSSFSAREMELMDIFASQVAAAVENTRLFQEIIRRNKELQILSEISAVVAQTLNFKKLIEQAVDKVLQLLEADAITFYLIDEESMTLKLFTHRGVGEEYLERFSVIRLRDDIKDKAAESFIPMAKAGTDRSDLSVPGSEIINGICALVKVRGKIIGAMAIGTKHRRQFAERDFDLLSAIGNQIGTAIENARLFERERDIAEVLQKSLLGRAPVIPGFEIGVAYEPALSEAAEVGGDFFDFIEFADGKTGVVIGDVSGKGIEAATLTSIAKNTVRAFAYENNSPGDVLTRVNEVLNSSTGAEEFVTLLFILLDVKSGLIRIASAAHPHAFICNGDCVLPKGGYGLPLGAFSDTKYTDTLVEIKKGQSLILYTDGLTDARSDGTMFGEEGIWRVASEYKMTMNAQELADRIVKEAKDFAGGRLVDDVAVIVLNLKK